MRRTSAALMLIALTAVFASCENKPAPRTDAPAAAPGATPAPGTAPAAAAPSGPSRNIGFELAPGEAVGALQFDVTYKGEGRFVGDADAVACETKVDGALSSYNHIVGEKKLRAAFASVKGFSGPTRVVDCKFQGEAKVEDFTVAINDSSTPDLAPVEPPPSIKVVLD